VEIVLCFGELGSAGVVTAHYLRSLLLFQRAHDKYPITADQDYCVK
jgi:hypothetical protein